MTTTAEQTQHAEQTEWYSISADDAFEQTGSSKDGLSEDEARRRLERDGPNELRPPKRHGPLMRFLRQFHNVLIYILIIAAIVTAFLQQWVDSAVITGVVLVNSIIGFIQEGKAEKALEAIRGMLAPEAVVVRNGKRHAIDAKEVVVGDVLLLQSGDKVSADIRLFEVKNLRIDEAVLTGESVAVEKSTEPVESDVPLGDRSSIAFSGTLVAQGQGRGIVAATGEDTEIGRISEMVSEAEAIQTPLLRQITRFSHTLSIIIIAVAAVTFAIGYLVYGYAAGSMFLAAVGLAVAAIPEGLPAIITITLSIGVQRMAKRNAIIRRLPAVETLGSVTVICSDKTGTLTRNEMTVKNIVLPDREFEVTGVGYEPHGGFELDGEEVNPEDHENLMLLIRAGLLCNDATLRNENGNWKMAGDPTEGCLVVAAKKAGLDHDYENEAYPRTDVIPFESEHKYMATLNHNHEGNAFIFLKGAPEKLLEMCSKQRTGNEDKPLDVEFWQEKQQKVASRGQRLLGIGYRPISDSKRDLAFEDVEKDMIFLGLVGIIDPPRDEAIRAAAECRSAGIKVQMITGDYAPTAQAVAGELGMDVSKEPLTGADIENMDDEEFQKRALEVEVFARSSPEHKIRLVKALQAGNRVVAMTGDGVNDAPALKQADIGVAMGVKGTEVAKEAAEMVLADDNFATIAHAVEEGRGVYDNLRKAILFMLPTNGGQSLAVIAAIFFGFGAVNPEAFVMAITPVQILWINMITTVTLALPLAFEPIEPGVMERPPREPGAPILSRFLVWRIAFVSVLLVVGAIGHFQWMLQQGASLPVARSVAINTLVAGQLFYLFNSRFIIRSSFTIKTLTGTRAVLLAIAVLVVLQASFTYLGFMQRLFGVGPIDAAAWGRIAIFAVAVFLVVEAEKGIFRLMKRSEENISSS